MASKAKTQRGGFGVGVVVGLLGGLVLALGVAVFVTKAPVPFVDKVPGRTAEQDAAEAEKNRQWDPNAPLHGHPPGRPAEPPPAAPPTQEPDPIGAIAERQSRPPEAASAPPPARPASKPPARAEASASAPAPAGGETSAKTGADPFTYFVQVGAYGSADEAEQQRARLAMNGLKARITEREQNGRVMHRVRLGPYDSREDAERMRDQLSASGQGDAALVRVPR